jgi:hypothetical protein
MLIQPVLIKPIPIMDIVHVLNLDHMFVTTPKDVYKKIHKDQAEGRISYWLQPKDYEVFKDNWNLIGSGF